MNLRVSTSGEEPLDVADSYCNLGSIHAIQQHYSLALERYQKALGLYLKIHGEQHFDIATSYENLGLVCRSCVLPGSACNVGALRAGGRTISTNGKAQAGRSSGAVPQATVSMYRPTF